MDCGWERRHVDALSILYLRCPEETGWAGLLYKSDLSILYLRCNNNESSFRTHNARTFNSLFEMLCPAEVLREVCKYYTFNSLFEMRRWRPRAMRSLSSAFNSLFEMLITLDGLPPLASWVNLSILYLRCQARQKLLTLERTLNLSILYLRCPEAYLQVG